MTQLGMILATAAYMAPEQAHGKRTDIWAFGCVSFEMLAGTRAFEVKTRPLKRLAPRSWLSADFRLVSP